MNDNDFFRQVKIVLYVIVGVVCGLTGFALGVTFGCAIAEEEIQKKRNDMEIDD